MMRAQFCDPMDSRTGRPDETGPLAARDNASEIVEAIRRLPVEVKLPFLLILGGATYKQASTILDTPMGTLARYGTGLCRI